MKGKKNRKCLQRLGKIIPGLLLGCLLGMGCQPGGLSYKEDPLLYKPTVAVMAFENHAVAQVPWNLGEAFADELANRLVQSHQFRVVDRRQWQALMSRNKRRQNGEENPAGGMRAIEYFIKGTLTDFTHVEKPDGLTKAIDRHLFGTDSHSLVSLTLDIIDAGTGQVITHLRLTEKQRDDKGHPTPELDGMAFGSYSFFETPMGEATGNILNDAVRRIIQTVEQRPYQPKIASILNNQVVINGGLRRQISVGDIYEVRPASRKIVDPDTGQRLGHITGEPLGRVRVVQVTDKYAIAEIEQGHQFEPGQTLFRVTGQSPRRSAAVSSY